MQPEDLKFLNFTQDDNFRKNLEREIYFSSRVKIKQIEDTSERLRTEIVKSIKRSKASQEDFNEVAKGPIT